MKYPLQLSYEKRANCNLGQVCNCDVPFSPIDTETSPCDHMNRVYMQFLKENDACDATPPIKLSGGPDEPDNYTYSVDTPVSARRAWLVSIRVNLKPGITAVDHGTVLYISDLKSIPAGTSAPTLEIYYISPGPHHVNLDRPLYVEESFQFRSKIVRSWSKIAESSVASPNDVVIPLKSYTFYFLPEDADYCTGCELCRGLVAMYAEIHNAVKTKCKDVDITALQPKYGRCDCECN